MKILLGKGVDVNSWDYVTKSTALHIATDYGHDGIVGALLGSKELNVNLRDLKLRTALHFAVERGSNALVMLLLDRGIDANAKDVSWDTALHIAARKTWSCDTCRVLLQWGVDVDARNKLGKTAILGATNPEVLQLLCEKGADINAQDQKGMTALHHAINTGNISVVAVLLENGANTEMREENYKKTALHMAALKGDSEIVEMLLEYGAMIDGKDGNGVTPLSKAVVARSVAVVEILLKNGAGRHVQDYFGISPFRRAIELSSNGEVVALMQTHLLRLEKDRNPKTYRELAADRELDKGRNPEGDPKLEEDEHLRAQKSPICSVVLQVARPVNISEKDEINKATNTPR